jgi:hypothetical protein
MDSKANPVPVGLVSVMVESCKAADGVNAEKYLTPLFQVT